MTLVKDIMKREVVTVGLSTSVSELMRLLREHRINGVPVVGDDEVLEGVISVRDVLRLATELGEVPEAAKWGLGIPPGERGEAVLQAPVEGEFQAYYVTPSGQHVDVRDRIREFSGDLFDGYRVRDIMTSDPVTVAPDASLQDLSRLLLDHNIHRALVVEKSTLVGIVTATDVLRSVAA